jgi:hypothetical protein
MSVPGTLSAYSSLFVWLKKYSWVRNKILCVLELELVSDLNFSLQKELSERIIKVAVMKNGSKRHKL